MPLRSTLRNFLCGVSAISVFILANLRLAQAQTPSPALLVLNKEDATLSIIDPVTLKTVALISTGEGPHEIAVSEDAKLAFVANYGTRTPRTTISVLDLAAQKELRRVDFGVLQRPHAIVFAGGKVWFTGEQNKLIARYDPASNQVDWLRDNPVFSKDGSQLFTSKLHPDSIMLLEQGSRTYAWAPEPGDFSPDGREYWTANSTDGTVSIIDVVTKKVMQILDVPTKHANRLKFTDDGRVVLISDPGNNSLVIVDAPSRKEVKRLNIGSQPEGILIPPDGARAYVAVAGEKTVAVLDLKTLEVTARISTGNGPDGMAWAQR